MNITYTLVNLLIWLFLKVLLIAFIVFPVWIMIKFLKKRGVSVFKRRLFGGLVGATIILFLFIPNIVSKVSEQYFEHLCKEESGLFVYKTVDDVDGMFMLRPRKNVTDKMLKDRYMPDPLGHDRKNFKSNISKFVGSNGYDFVEMAVDHEIRLEDTSQNIKYNDLSMFDEPGSGDKYVRYCCYDERNQDSIVKEYSTTRKSRYGYTWKDISYPYDRQLGIAGSELTVTNIESGEVLALFRGFVRSRRLSGDGWSIFVPVNWGGPKCPIEDKRDLNFKIISSILKPKLDLKENQGGDYE